MSSLKSSFNTFWNFSEHITHWKDFQILIYKTLKFFSLEKVHFLRFFQNTRIWFATKSASVDQVLTKIFQIDPKLTFNVFHILNHDHISKIEKYIWCYNPSPPQKKKAPFFGGGVPSGLFSISEIRPWFKIWKTLKVSDRSEIFYSTLGQQQSI